jgi:hypothetical protein
MLPTDEFFPRLIYCLEKTVGTEYGKFIELILED